MRIALFLVVLSMLSEDAHGLAPPSPAQANGSSTSNGVSCGTGSRDHGPDADVSCDELSSNLARAFKIVALAREQTGAFRALFDQSYEAYQSCPDAELVGYALARSTELGFANLPVELDGQTLTNAAAVIERLGSRQPRSGRIATVRARQVSTMASAQAALAVDPSYSPATLALAAATMANDPKAALKLMDGIRDIKALPGFHTLRARILLAAGNARAAAIEARHDIDGAWADTIEPFWMVGVRREAEEVLGRALLASGRRPQALSHLRAAAELGSAAARAVLDAARP
jgi:hypothetical protein